jgi:hypothetical protein
MNNVHDMLYFALIVWGAVTAALIVLVIYRSTLETREGDQIFLDSAEHSMAEEQREIVARIDKLATPIKALIVASAVLLVASGALWLFEGFRNF